MLKRPPRKSFRGDATFAATWLWYGRKLLRKIDTATRMGGKLLGGKRQRESFHTPAGDYLEFDVYYLNGEPQIDIFAEERKGGVVLIYMDSITDEDVVKIYGWDPARTIPRFHIFSIDLKKLNDGLLTQQLEIVPHVDGLGHIVFRRSQANPWLEVIDNVEFDYRYSRRGVSGRGTGTPLNFDDDGPFPFNKYHRGFTRHFFYTTDGIQEIGDDENARIYYRDYADEQREILPFLTLPQPIYATYPLTTDPSELPEPIHWPPIGFDIGWPSHFYPSGDGIHIRTVSARYGDNYIEFYYIDPQGNPPVLMLVLVPWYKGGASYCDFNSYVVDFSGTVSGFTLSEYNDTGGAYSDLEQVHIAEPDIWTGGIAIPHFEFRPSDYLEYTQPRDDSSFGRETKVWRIDEEVYGILLQNTKHEVTPGTNQKPDAFFLYNNGEISLVYTPTHPPVPDDYPGTPYDAHIGIFSLEVDPYRPNLVVCREYHRWDVNYAKRWMVIDMLSGAVKVVKEGDIYDPQFVR